MVGRTTPLIGIAALLALLALLPLTACSGAPRTLFGKSIDGQILDAQTGQPIAGAHVMYLWESTPTGGAISGEGTSAICYHAAATTTDAQGRYHIGAWEKPQRYQVPNREPSGWAYARGYVPEGLAPPSGPEREPTVHPNDVFRLQPSNAGGDKRLDELWHVIRRGCFHGGMSQRSLVPMLRAAYDEAKSAAVTPEQMSRVRRFARLVARAWISPDPLGDGGVTDQQIERFIRETLQ